MLENTEGQSITYNAENTEGAINNVQCRNTGNIGYTRQTKTKHKHNIIYMCWTQLYTTIHNYTQINTNNVNKT